MTIGVVAVLEELAELMKKALKQAKEAPDFTDEANYWKGYADALGLAWDVVFNKAHMSEEGISIK